MISDTPTITQSELSDQLGIALPKIKRTMAAMAKRQVLARKGGKRHGFWEVKDRKEQ
ncbi:MAG: winged helix-turn-helix transcriptional regulator [Sphaerochaeta sp.]|jgi:predicted HTH transcriptional regulator|nr:winged helix-turn-helix transcriptional regulator [Sphaerochaeta sp.]